MQGFCMDWITAVGDDIVNLTIEECAKALDDIVNNRHGEYDDARKEYPWAFDTTPDELLRCVLKTLLGEVKRLMAMPPKPVSCESNEIDAVRLPALLRKIESRLDRFLIEV